MEKLDMVKLLEIHPKNPQTRLLEQKLLLSYIVVLLLFILQILVMHWEQHWVTKMD